MSHSTRWIKMLVSVHNYKIVVANYTLLFHKIIFFSGLTL